MGYCQNGACKVYALTLFFHNHLTAFKWNWFCLEELLMTASYNAFFAAALKGSLKMRAREIGPKGVACNFVAQRERESLLQEEESVPGGTLVRTLYSNGTKSVRRLAAQGQLEMFVAWTPDGTYWYTTNKNGWFPLD